MIAIIAAMDVEVDAFKRLMSDVKIDKNGYIIGKLAKKDIVLAKSGVGKVGAAINTTKLALLYDIHLIINIGSAGSLSKDVRIGDVVIANDIAFHDIEVPDWPKGFNQSVTCYHTNRELLAKIKIVDTELKCHFGPMVSGDSFIMHKEQTDKILKEFPGVLCVEMESASIAQTATYFGIDFLILRSISDVTIEEGNEIDFDEFVGHAAINSANYTKKVIEELDL